MLFLLGLLVGLLAGITVRIRYLRQEIAATTGPRRRRVELRPGTLRAELSLGTGARLSALSRGGLHA